MSEGQLHLAEEDLPPDLVGLLGPYLARQRWYAGTGVPSPLRVASSGCLAEPAPGGRLLWAVASAGHDRYQLLLAEAPDDRASEHLVGREEALVGSAGGRTYYDATVDPAMAIALLEVASGGAEHAKTARRLGVEQSNTSVVYDEAVILKVFRRLSTGPNPDAEVTSALRQVGFTHVAAPVLRWREGETDLAFGQQYLAGGTDGWALALTSLRDLYSPEGSGSETDLDRDATYPGLRGGDFAAEAGRLGRVTAEMHLSMVAAFGVTPDWRDGWARLLGSVEAQVEALGEDLGGTDGGLAAAARGQVGQLRGLGSLGPAIRQHGDYHLGQVMRTDTGWFVLDFEGEPNRPLEERLSPASPMKDIAGMLRSFHYAAHSALAERGGDDWLVPLARAWEERNRRAFVQGYLSCEGADRLLPSSLADREALCLAFELDKVLYEVSYERAFRPAWAGIPLSGLRQLLTEPPGAFAVHESS